MNESYLHSCFWNSLHFAEDFSLFTSYQNSHKFFVLLIALHISALVMFYANVLFCRDVDILLNQTDECIKVIKIKLKSIQSDHKKLTNIKKRTEEQTETCRKCEHMISMLRTACVNNFRNISEINSEN